MRILVALLAAGLGVPQDPPEETTLQKIEREVAAVVEKARKSVVLVEAQHRIQVQPGVWVTDVLKFSGVVWSADGLVVTDAGGLIAAQDVNVVLPDGTDRAAVILCADRRTSVAVLRIKAEGLTPAELPGAAEPRQGTWAIAVGNPHGLKGSASVGFVSGLSRSALVGGRRFDDLLQMTTLVQPGDCGGFAANSKGQLLGLVHSSHQAGPLDPETLGVLKLFGKDAAEIAGAGGPATSFVTTASTVKLVVERVLRTGKVEWGWAGLSLAPLDDETRQAQAIAPGLGARVTSVEKAGPAKRAGFRRNDVLIEFDGRAVSDTKAVRRRVAEADPPKTFKAAVLRDGKRLDLELTIDPEPAP